MTGLCRKWLMAFMAVAVALLVHSCHTTEGDVKLPSDARNFIYRYFPLNYVESKEKLPSGDFRVIFDSGPTVIFDPEGKWTSIDANGGTLPPIIAFDYFPSALYDYIESHGQTDGIYSVSRDAARYNVLLLDSRLTYIIATGKVIEN